MSESNEFNQRGEYAIDKSQARQANEKRYARLCLKPAHLWYARQNVNSTAI